MLNQINQMFGTSLNEHELIIIVIIWLSLIIISGSYLIYNKIKRYQKKKWKKSHTIYLKDLGTKYFNGGIMCDFKRDLANDKKNKNYIIKL